MAMKLSHLNNGKQKNKKISPIESMNDAVARTLTYIPIGNVNKIFIYVLETNVEN